MTWTDLARIYQGWNIASFKGESDGKGTQVVYITLEKKP